VENHRARNVTPKQVWIHQKNVSTGIKMEQPIITVLCKI